MATGVKYFSGYNDDGVHGQGATPQNSHMLSLPVGVYMLGDLIFNPIWEAIARLERLFVLVLCRDGASSNQRLWKLHSKGKELINRVHNVFAAEISVFHFRPPTPHKDNTK